MTFQTCQKSKKKNIFCDKSKTKCDWNKPLGTNIEGVAPLLIQGNKQLLEQVKEAVSSHPLKWIFYFQYFFYPIFYLSNTCRTMICSSKDNVEVVKDHIKEAQVNSSACSSCWVCFVWRHDSTQSAHWFPKKNFNQISRKLGKNAYSWWIFFCWCLYMSFQ